jgi:transcriptional regulator with XRE-family HTH domain
MQVVDRLEGMGRVKLSEQIRQAIDASGKSRRDISKEAGISESLMSRFMSGDSWLSEEYLNRIADVLKLNLQLTKRQRRGKS